LGLSKQSNNRSEQGSKRDASLNLYPVCFYVLKMFLKKFKILLFFSLFKINFFFVFADHFDIHVKINLQNKKNMVFLYPYKFGGIPTVLVSRPRLKMQKPVQLQSLQNSQGVGAKLKNTRIKEINNRTNLITTNS
jgi:hypothetical protein